MHSRINLNGQQKSNISRFKPTFSRQVHSVSRILNYIYSFYKTFYKISQQQKGLNSCQNFQYQMLKYKPAEVEFEVKSLKFETNVPKNTASPVFVLLDQNYLDKQFTNPYFTSIQWYALKNKDLAAQIKSGKLTKLYSFNEKDPFSSCWVKLASDPQEDGVKLIRKAQKEKGPMKLEHIKSPKNSTTVILPEAYTVAELNKFLLGLRVANFTWTRETWAQDKPITKYSINNLVIVSQLKEQEIQEINQKDWTNKILFNLPRYINNLRSIVLKRPNEATTTYMLEYVSELAASLGESVKLNLIKGDDLLNVGLNLIHAVGRGSLTPPFLSVLSYKGNPESDSYFALVGKGVCYDSGGLNIKKDNLMMGLMWIDKAGACTVLETFRAIVELKLPVNVVCGTPFVENAVGPNSYRNGDIIQSYKGLSVEITDTDCEGRLILADTMSYIQDNFNVADLIDIATLSVVMFQVAGPSCGIYTNREQFANQVKKAATLSKENFCVLPFTDLYFNASKGTYSNVANNARSNYAPAFAASFLQQFVEKKVRWQHWDIASLTGADVDLWAQRNNGNIGFGLPTILYHLAIQSNLIQFPTKEKQTEEAAKPKQEETPNPVK